MTIINFNKSYKKYFEMDPTLKSKLVFSLILKEIQKTEDEYLSSKNPIHKRQITFWGKINIEDWLCH